MVLDRAEMRRAERPMLMFLHRSFLARCPVGTGVSIQLIRQAAQDEMFFGVTERRMPVFYIVELNGLSA